MINRLNGFTNSLNRFSESVSRKINGKSVSLLDSAKKFKGKLSSALGKIESTAIEEIISCGGLSLLRAAGVVEFEVDAKEGETINSESAGKINEKPTLLSRAKALHKDLDSVLDKIEGTAISGICFLGGAPLLEKLGVVEFVPLNAVKV